ncbi:hypothetical protein [Methylocella sp.]|jgi:hypothetical protein|uniref:hypothetical protein n=1 Tax=Methylocella sp. TaxID=1978226 RepID=UPI003C2194BA
MANEALRQSRAAPASSLLALALGAAALGAIAIGAVAIGRLAVGRLVIKKARFGALEVDELTVRRLRVVEREDQKGAPSRL